MPLTDIERRELKRFRDRVKIALGEGRLDVRLFGSKARGDDRPDSDVDVLVLTSNDDWQTRKKVSSIAMDALLDAGVLLSPKTISRRRFRELREQGAPFVRNVTRDGAKI